MDLSSRLEVVQQYLDRLEKRERITVISGAVIVLITFFYLLIIDPVFSSLNEERQRYQAQRELLTWMQGTAQEIRALESAGGSSASRFMNQSVSSLVERSAISSGVKAFIKKQESDASGVKVQLEKADFDRLVVWINDMQQKYAIQASKIVIEPGKESGAVDARVTLERPES